MGAGLRKEALPHAFCARLRARGGLRLIPRGSSRAERGGVGNLGKEVLIEDYGLDVVFFFFFFKAAFRVGWWDLVPQFTSKAFSRWFSSREGP